MNTSTTILPGIARIGWFNCNLLPRRVDLKGIARMRVPVLTDIFEIFFLGDAECECTTERESHKTTSTATLRFHASESLPLHYPLGFVVETTDGEQYLIGSKENPRPIVKVSESSGTPSGDAAGYRYEVTLTSLCSLIECIASF